MLILLSPAKTLDFDPHPLQTHTQPQLMEQTLMLASRARELSAGELGSLMKISDALATLNARRFEAFTPEHRLGPEAKQALLAFKGDVYRDWPLDEYSADDFAYAQDHLRILSGLYGLLRPLDVIHPYRLEMGTRLSNPRGKNLYAFWGDRIGAAVQSAVEAQGDRVLVNLASHEYFKSVKAKTLDVDVISPVFKDQKGDTYKVIAFHAKRARGMMAHFLLSRRVSDRAGLVGFNLGGYRYDPEGSTEAAPLFLRDA